MEKLYESKDPVLTLPIQAATSSQVQKSASKKKSKNKKTHTVNAMDEEIITTKSDQCTIDKNIRTAAVSKANAPINGIVKQVENLHIKDNGYCLSNGNGKQLNGHQHDEAQHESKIVISTKTTTKSPPANQLVNEKSKKSKSKSKTKEHCQLKNVDSSVENGVDPLMAINTGKPTVLSTAQERTTIVTDEIHQEQSEKVRDIIATAVAAAAITIDSEETKKTENETLVTDPALEEPKIHIDYTEYQSELQMHVSFIEMHNST